MGARAEARFRKYNREYFDHQIEAKKDSIEAASMFEEIQDLRAALKAEREKNARAMTCIKRLRVYLTGARHQTTEARAETKSGHGEMMKWFRAFEAKNRAWLKLSPLVHELCDPAKVAAWREENRDADK